MCSSTNQPMAKKTTIALYSQRVPEPKPENTAAAAAATISNGNVKISFPLKLIGRRCMMLLFASGKWTCRASEWESERVFQPNYIDTYITFIIHTKMFFIFATKKKRMLCGTFACPFRDKVMSERARVQELRVSIAAIAPEKKRKKERSRSTRVLVVVFCN